MSEEQKDTDPQEAEAVEDGESVLSEEELEALRGTDSQSSADQEGCLAYDFRDPARILNGRLPGMDSVNEIFIKSMEDKLFAFLRRPVVVQSGETLLSRQCDYLNTLPLPASVQSVHLPAQDSTIFVTLEGALAYSCVDAYFGGRGAEMPDNPEREFSASERRVINLVTQMILVELKAAWAQVCVLEFVNPQALNLAVSGSDHDDQILVVTKFKIELQPGIGEFHVVLPYSLLDLLRPLLSAGPRPGETNQQWLSKLHRQVWQISVDTYSLFQEVEITVGELMALQPGDFIPIPEENRVTVMVDDVPLYVAEPGTSEGLAAAKILSRVSPGGDT